MKAIYRNNKATHTQAGFTLIEMIVVMVVIALLAVTAVMALAPMTQSAVDAVAQGTAAEMTGASKTNFGVETVTPGAGVVVATCAAVLDPALVTLPVGYTAVAAGGATPPGATTPCTLILTNTANGLISAPATFIAIGT